ncbi:MAG TPA: hypothetical protein VGA96_03245, partial [Fibrella sp.]
GWFLKTPLLPLSALWVIAGSRYLNRGNKLSVFLQTPGWYGMLVLAGLLLATVLPSFYATQFLTLRAINITYAVFLFGWFYLITSQLPRIQSFAPTTAPIWLAGITGVWLLSNLLTSQPMKQLYGDLLRGNAATYDREMTARHQYLAGSAPADTLRLAPLSVYPASLFLEDVRTDPMHWWNRCQSGYYHHKTIVIDTTLRAPVPHL